MKPDYCEGYDVVYAERHKRRGESYFKTFIARAFYFLMRKLIMPNLPANVGDFRLINRHVCDALGRMPEHSRFLCG